MDKCKRLTTGCQETDQLVHRGIEYALSVMFGYGWDYLFDEYREKAFWPSFLKGIRLYGFDDEAAMFEELHRIIESHQIPEQDEDDPFIEQIEGMALTVEETRRFQEVENVTSRMFDQLLNDINLDEEREGLRFPNWP